MGANVSKSGHNYTTGHVEWEIFIDRHKVGGMLDDDSQGSCCPFCDARGERLSEDASENKVGGAIAKSCQ